MPTIDALLEEVERERQVAQQYYKFAREIKDNSDLEQLLKEMAVNEEKQAIALEEKTMRLLEVEKW